MFTVSQGSLQLVLNEIRNGVTYPDFWVNRYGEDDVTEEATTETEEEQKKAE